MEYEYIIACVIIAYLSYFNCNLCIIATIKRLGNLKVRLKSYLQVVVNY